MPTPWSPKMLFHDDGATNEAADLEPDDSEHGHQSIFHCVTPDDRALRNGPLAQAVRM